jgi:hypothetical protein
MAGIEGSKNFRDFADDISDFSDRVDDILDNAAEQTAAELKAEIITQIEKKQTSKGGTLDSDTSKYSPGGENKSTKSSMKLSDYSSWGIETTRSSNSRVRKRIYPKEGIRDRANMLEGGTSGPEGEDTPMYFNVYGVTIVVSSVPPTSDEGVPIPLADRFDGEPRSIDGVEPQNFVADAFNEIEAKNRLKKNIEKEFERQLQQSDLDAGI